jgi:hypothetical protein
LDIDPVSPVYHEICVLRGHPDPGLAIPEVKAGQVSDRWGAA